MFEQTLAHKPRCFFVGTGLLCGMLVLSACGNTGLPSAFKPNTATKHILTPQTETVILDSGSITISPPPGFCKDTTSSKTTEESTFFIYANCGNISTEGKYSTDGTLFSGLVTTSVAKTASFETENDINSISEFLSSPEGLKTLSTSGDANAVSILDKRQSSDAVFLQIKDQNSPVSQNVWKSFLNKNNHLVTVTMLKDKDDRLTDEQAMQFLQSYSETISNTNTVLASQTAIAPQPISPHISTENAAGGQNKLKKVGLLRRLLL